MSNYLTWLRRGARAGRLAAKSSASRAFFEALDNGLREAAPCVGSGNRRFIEQPITAGLIAALETARRPGWAIRKAYRVELVGSPLREKEVDVAVIGSRQRAYLIEQKTVLRFNAFAEAAFSGWCIRRAARSVRFVGVFNHIYGATPDAMTQLADDAAEHKMIHRCFILCPDSAESLVAPYEPTVIDALVRDVRQYLV